MSVEPHPVTYVTRLPKHRHICFWAFVLIILVGVVSIAAGVALFASPTDRELRVDEYNRAVDEYNNGIMRSLALNWSGTVNGVAVKVKLQPVPYVGDPTDIREAVSVVAVASVDTGVGAYSWNLSPNFPSFSSAFTLTGTNLYNMYCDRQNCASGCTDPAAYHCTAASITATCRTLFGSQASYYGSDCDAGGYCGGCSYSMYLANQCFVASYAATTATWTILNQSCFTPFTDTPTLRLSSGRTGLYTSVQPASVTSVMRTSDDPRLLMQTMTGGSMDFGPPEYTGLSRRGYATVIVTVGAFVTLTGVGLLVWFTCFREPTTMSRTPSLDEDEDAPLPPSHLHTGAMYPTPSTSAGSTPVPYLGPHHQGVTDAV